MYYLSLLNVCSIEEPLVDMLLLLLLLSLLLLLLLLSTKETKML